MKKVFLFLILLSFHFTGMAQTYCNPINLDYAYRIVSERTAPVKIN